MKNKVIDIVSRISQIDKNELLNNLDKEDLWESFTNIEIIMQVENEFNIRFSEEEIAQIRSINTIVKALESKVSNK